MDIICKKLANEMFYAYHKGRFWRWDDARSVWKESHLMAQKFERAKAAIAALTPEDFLSSAEFEQPDEYELDFAMVDALKSAKPCKTAPIEPVEEAEVPCKCSTCTCSGCKEECFGNCHHCGHPVEDCNSYQTGGEKHLASVPQDKPAAPSFDFGADEQTNALLLQDAQTFITGNMARIMAAKHAHDLCANNKNGTWGKWCNVVGISRDTGDNMVHIAEQFGNIQIDGQSIFDVRPMKLLYAAAKPSTPEEVKQAVFTGDITTYKEYQELMAQFKAEKDRADTAEHQLEAAQADVAGLKERVDSAEAREEEAWKMQSKAEARAKTAEEALKHQPITAVIDEEEIDRRAAEKAWGLADARNTELAKDNADLKKQLTALRSRINDDAQADFEQANYCASLMRAAWDNSKASYSRLVGEDLESTFQTICATLNAIREEASLLCRQPPDYDGGNGDE